MCTNPFADGCLRRIMGADNAKNYIALPKRSCNSDDGYMGRGVGDHGGHKYQFPLCSMSDFDYP